MLYSINKFRFANVINYSTVSIMVFNNVCKLNTDFIRAIVVKFYNEV